MLEKSIKIPKRYSRQFLFLLLAHLRIDVHMIDSMLVREIKRCAKRAKKKGVSALVRAQFSERSLRYFVKEI